MKQSLYSSVNSISVSAIENGICSRCGSRHFDFDTFGRRFCVECAHLSKLNEDDQLYRIERTMTVTNQVMHFSYELSKKQRDASDFLLEKASHRESVFLHAVCGAGKTEMLFASILFFIGNGKRVCISVPRVQVVKELAKRLEVVFPKAFVKAIHQDQKEDENATILVASTMQLHRYYQEFDLMIVDEVDAFPLLGNEYLHRLIRRSMKENGCLVFLSATLPKLLEEWIHEDKMCIYSVDERFHGQPLDLPEIRFLPRLDKSIQHGELPTKIMRVLLDNPRSFVYVPTISIAHQVQMLLSSQRLSSMMISSRSTDKEHVLKSFEKGTVDYLVTTTILERGVTYSNLNVIVLLADHEVFSKETLIQICGRVGRKIDAPHGNIFFFAGSITSDMKDTIQTIRQINRGLS